MRLRLSGYLETITEYAVYGVIFSIPISTSMIGVFAGIAIASFLMGKALSPDLGSIRSNRIFFLLLLLFFLFMVLSLFNSGSLFAKSLKALLIKWGRFPLLLWVIIDRFRDTGRVVRGVYVLLFSAALVGLTVFTQRFFGFEFLRGKASGYGGPITGPFKNQNGLAAYLSCAIPIILDYGLWIWNKTRAVVKLPFVLIVGLLVMAIVWTTSRGGLLGLTAGLIYIALFVNYPRIKKVFWPMFATSYLIIMPLMTTVLLFVKNKAGSDNERIIIIKGALRMIKAHPFLGTGIGTFMDRCASYTNSLGGYYAHNCYLQMCAETGIFSLVSFLLLMGYLFYRSIKAILNAPGSPNSLILIGLSAGLLGFLVHSFFEINLYSFQHSFLFWVVLGLTVALTQINESTIRLGD